MNKLLIADKGIAAVSIVVGADAPQEVKTAARDMAHILWRITGAKFAVTESCEGASIHYVIDEKLEEEEFEIKSSPCFGLRIAGERFRIVIKSGKNGRFRFSGGVELEVEAE